MVPRATPDTELAAKIVARLQQADLVLVGDVSGLSEKIAKGALMAEDWKRLAERLQESRIPECEP